MTLPLPIVWIAVAVVVTGGAVDLWKAKVPNRLTYTSMVAGLAYWTWAQGLAGLGWSGLGLCVSLILAALAIHGLISPGDAKSFMAIAPWIGPVHTFHILLLGLILGGLIGLGIMIASGKAAHYFRKLRELATHYLTIRDVTLLTELNEQRKTEGENIAGAVPFAIATVAYFFYQGMLF
jgi:Flp pilus assembly protein protease CpaA